METQLTSNVPQMSFRYLRAVAGLFCILLYSLPAVASPDDWAAQVLGYNSIAWDENVMVSGKHPQKNQTAVSLACIPEVNVSLGQLGYAVITPLMLVSSFDYPPFQYRVDIMGPLRDTVYCAQLGQELMVIVTELPTGNACMSSIYIEDKLKPTLICTSDTLPCNTNIGDIDFESYLEDVIDNCDDDPDVWYSFVIQNMPCNQFGFTAQILVNWTATDASGNSATCQDVIFLKKPSLGQIVFPPNVTVSCTNPNIDPDVVGEPTFNGEPIDVSCQYTVWYTDVLVPMCEGSQKIKRTWTVKDWCTSGMRSELQTIHIVDNNPPTIVCPPSITISGTNGLCTAQYTLPAPTVSDQCADPQDIDIDITISGIPGIFNPGYVVTLGFGTSLITMKATDPCGNTRICQYSVTVKDNNGPIINCPPDLTVSCNDNTLPPATGVATATDICDPSPDITFTDVTVASSTTCAFGYSINRTWKATDSSGNTSCCTQHIELTDDVPPTITCPGNVTITCTTNPLPANTGGSATATDLCDNSPDITFTDVTVDGTCPQEKFINRTWSATDNCDNTSTCLQIIAIQDNIAPTVTCPDDITVECADGTDPGMTGSATATDNCDPAPEVTFADVTSSGSGPQQFNVNRTWIASDACGNTSTCLQIIVVHDEEPPSITCPSSVTISCEDSTLPAANGEATAVDNCDDDPSITFTDDFTDGSCTEEGIITRTWIANDDCGNSSTCIQTITIVDETAPFITCPDNVTLSCIESTSPENTGTASASDNCDLDVEVTFSDNVVAGICPQESTINRTWTATDNCGNETTCLQIISVIDDVPPSISCPDNTTISCTDDSTPANTGSATASDICDNDVDIAFTDDVQGGACPQEAVITRTWTATDDCGNQSTCVQIINIEDNAAPVIVCPDDVTIDCSAGTDPSQTGGSATAVDDCDPAPEVTFEDTTVGGGGGGDCTQGTINRTWTATDACGNTSTCLQVIHLQDEQNPVITCPDDVTLDCTESTDPSNTGTATATDNCAGDLIPTFTDEVVGGNCPENMTITRTWLATDVCGNTASCIQIISVMDNTGPVLTCPPDVVIECGESTATSNTGVATASDACDPFSGIIFNDVTSGGVCPEVMVITRTFVANDDCGNTSTCVQIISIQDNQAPVVNCPDDLTIDCAASTDPANTGSATGSDNCGQDVDITFSDVTVGDCPQEYLINRTWTATDVCGNTSTCVQLIQLDDSTAPTCNAVDITVAINGNGTVTITGEDVDGGSVDDCNPVTLTVEPNIFDCTDLGPNEVVLTVTDCAGNFSTCTAIVTVMDNGGLVANCQNVTIFVDQNGNASIDPEQVDNGSGGGCAPGDLEFELTQTNFNCTNLGPNIVTLTVTDQNGNTATCTAVITVADNMPPTIQCPANLTVDCHTVTDPNNTGQFGNATGDDNCPPPIITETHIINLNDCNVGTITRTFTATDGAGLTATCVQVVTVSNPDPLDASDITWPPSPVSVNICNSSAPGNIPNGFPVISQNALLCADPVITFMDQTVTNVDNNPATPCMVITRTWTIVDNCQPNGVFMFVQTINIQDMAPPVFTNINNMTKVANANCVAFFTLIASATDCAGVTITNDSPYGATTGANASGNYPIGVTTVIFTATDGCGNTSTMDVVITVTDPDPTDFLCEKVIFILPLETEIAINAESFITFFEGNCTTADDFYISYSNTNPYDTVRVYDCGDVGVSTFPLYFWNINGPTLIDSCATADLDLRDPSDFCQDGLVVIGEVTNEAGMPIHDIEVSILNAPMIPDTTDSRGNYIIEGLAENTGYFVAPYNDLKHKAGVSTLDLVMIQKHLLGLAKLNSPYKMIAADANKSGSITAVDILEIRKLILGIIPRFTNNTSWRFIDKSYDFPNPYNPFSPGFVESAWLDSVTLGIDTANFIGIKTGDVNGSFFTTLGNGSKIEPRSGEPFQLKIEMEEQTNVSDFRWEMRAASAQGLIEGLQFSMVMGLQTAAALQSIHSDIIPAHSWYYDAETATLRVSWVPDEAVDLSGMVLFTGLKDTRSTEAFYLTEGWMAAEAYLSDGDQYQIREVKLQSDVQPDVVADDYELFQNIPNPFSEGTIIRFSLPKPEKVKLIIHDVAGRTTFVKETLCTAGFNEIQLSGKDLGAPGIYYYTLQTLNASLTRKMSFIQN